MVTKNIVMTRKTENWTVLIYEDSSPAYSDMRFFISAVSSGGSRVSRYAETRQEAEMTLEEYVNRE
jgi:hypothetical protein